MDAPQLTIAEQVAEAVMAFQQRTTGHAPKAATAVLGQDTLVVTLREALSPAEKDLAKSPAGAAKVQEFHRQLFSASSHLLREEIQRIPGLQARGAVAEVEPLTWAMVCAFASGTMVQVFQLAGSAPTGQSKESGVQIARESKVISTKGVRYGTDPADRGGRVAGRRPAHLEPQPKLGLPPG